MSRSARLRSQRDDQRQAGFDHDRMHSDGAGDRQKEATVAKTLQLIGHAANRGARLVVLPEICNSGYMFESRQEALALAEPVPDGPTMQAWSELAARHDLHIVAGISERAGDALFNSSVLIGPGGHLGTFRKVHLWNEENLYFEPGDLGFPVFGTALGRIATFICYDCWFPESFRLCALQGAEIVCVPTNWVPIPGQDPAREAMANILVHGSGAQQLRVRRGGRSHRHQARPAVHRPERHRGPHRLADRRTGKRRWGGDPLR